MRVTLRIPRRRRRWPMRKAGSPPPPLLPLLPNHSPDAEKYGVPFPSLPLEYSMLIFSSARMERSPAYCCSPSDCSQSPRPRVPSYSPPTPWRTCTGLPGSLPLPLPLPLSKPSRSSSPPAAPRCALRCCSLRRRSSSSSSRRCCSRCCRCLARAAASACLFSSAAAAATESCQSEV